MIKIAKIVEVLGSEMKIQNIFREKNQLDWGPKEVPGKEGAELEKKPSIWGEVIV